MLLLFDIDQTLISVRHGIGRRIVTEAFSLVYGVDPTVHLEGYSFGGRTDRSIVHDLARASGMTDGQAERGWMDYCSILEDRMTTEVRDSDIDILPGVSELIARLADEHRHTLALVTGNVKRIAFHKLSLGALGHAFHHGAFGCEHIDRSMLPPIAQKRVNEALGTSFSARECLVIGDAPADVTCATDNGMLSLAVATGGFDPDVLRSAGAHAVVTSFADVDTTIDIIDALG